MAAITARKNKVGETAYRVRIRKKGQPMVSATFGRLTDAKRWAKLTEAALDERRYFKTAESERHTLAELIDRYKSNVLVHKSPKSILTQGQQLNYWREQIGHLALADITPALIVEHKDRLLAGVTVRGGGRAPGSVNRYLGALSHVFTVGTNEWGWLEDSPMRKVGKLREPRGRVRFLSDDERARLLKACKQSTNGDLFTAVVLALSTAARQQEIMALRWPNVDMQCCRITLHETKNGERRSLPLHGHALELVRERGKVRRIDTDLLFPSDKNPQQPVNLRRPFGIALSQAEIEDFRWHDLRHTAASYLAMNGATLSELAKILGHKTLEMVMRYSHLTEEHTSDVVARMNAKMFND